MGGGDGLDVALRGRGFTAVVIHYGHLATDRESLKKINAAVLGNFGAQGQGIAADDVKNSSQHSSGTENLWILKSTPMPDTPLRNRNNLAGCRSSDASRCLEPYG
jgi:dienelactone hydrolase